MTERNRGIAQANKERRRVEAEARTAAWQAMTPNEQMLDLDSRFGKGKGSTKQRVKIQKLIDAGKGDLRA
jgi:hypothetical protein